ncbi:hypothetical protein HW49_09610 [Porphyromonadaceae bacterium COT-184 OH4590]|nr:hypothetical protein HW49_09610 [Porphyromonadaceae bacterium COT-184 OH4590]MDO4726177.1 hypothetical protein [Porphyromonadaceae bacterium]
MRFVIVLWFFYVSVLMVLPCERSYKSGRLGAVADTSHTLPLHGDDDHHYCTPFCNSCSAKSVLAAEYKFYYITSPTVMVANRNTPLHNTQPITDYYGNIWTPPKIKA